MRKAQDQEPLLPPWVGGVLWKFGPLVLLAGIYYVLSGVLHVPPAILVPALIVLALGALVYVGGRLYKPFYVDRQGRCIAQGAAQKAACRHFSSGARLGGACGRLRENGRCRYVH